MWRGTWCVRRDWAGNKSSKTEARGPPCRAASHKRATYKTCAKQDKQAEQPRYSSNATNHHLTTQHHHLATTAQVSNAAEETTEEDGSISKTKHGCRCLRSCLRRHANSLQAPTQSPCAPQAATLPRNARGRLGPRLRRPHLRTTIPRRNGPLRTAPRAQTTATCKPTNAATPQEPDPAEQHPQACQAAATGQQTKPHCSAPCS